MKTFLDVLRSQLTTLEQKQRFLKHGHGTGFSTGNAKVELERIAIRIDGTKKAIEAYKKAEKLK